MTSQWKRSERVQIAVQKSGRLTDHSLALLTRCGLRLTRGTDELMAVAENMPVDVLLVRDDEIPSLVREGACDLGVVGLNVAEEQRLGLDEGQPVPTAIRNLDFGGCRLAMAYPRDGDLKSVQDLGGLRVASSYPRLTGRYLAEKGVDAEIVPFSGRGGACPAPRPGGSDLRPSYPAARRWPPISCARAKTVLESRASLLLSPAEVPDARREWVDLIRRRVDGVMQARETKYIMLHAPRPALHTIAELLPGSESPTIMALEGSDDRVAVHAVCRESVFWETLEALKGAGASFPSWSCRWKRCWNDSDSADPALERPGTGGSAREALARAAAPADPALEARVREIMREVRSGGDAALKRLEAETGRRGAGIAGGGTGRNRTSRRAPRRRKNARRFTRRWRTSAPATKRSARSIPAWKPPRA